MARKSRKQAVVSMPAPSLYVHVALYIRLSVEDNKKRGCSVENQKLVLNDFLADKPDFVVYDTYIDNGATGTNFHRPGFQQMLSDIEAGHIDCVIVKDLSRLGRNSIDTGYYIEQYFYSHNVRFIAVTDQFDTADPGNLHGGIMLPLKNMINEAYALDIGRKIKAQARQAMKDGDYIGGRAPYGYRKDPDNCHKLLVDETAAPVVKQIFEWAHDRVSLNRIVLNLNEMGIPAPSHYKKSTGEITSPGLIGSGKWQTRTVMKILESEVYTGDLVQGKTKIVDHQQVKAGEDFKTESLSIPNQKLILREKAMSLPEWDNGEVLEFVDNGHTGTNFERPAVQELLTMVQAGKIDCIIVKDLSRFGRNSIETGYFIERVFPLYHTRFISVSDDFDTANFKGDTGGIDVAFKYLISECYSRDMSMKTKSAKYAKMRRGEYQSVICPYGYRKSADGRMEPDEDAAGIVRQIFEWAADGNTAAEITRKLYAMNIPTPGEYRKSKGKDHYNVSRTHGVWSSSTVLRMLEDQRYIGTYVIGKRKVREIGSRRVQLKDESEWFKIPDHHPAIVSMELFEKANASIRRFSLPNKKRRDYLLRGKVFCGCCDHAMSLRNGAWFYCRHSEVAKELPCYGVKVKMSELEQVVFDTTRAQMGPALGIDSSKDKLDLQTIQQAEHEEKLHSIQDSKRQLYEQYALGEIDLETYQERKAVYDAELVQAKNVHAAITAQTKQIQSDYEAKLKQREIVREVGSADTLTQALIDRLISKVYIFPGNRIEIEYVTQDFLGIDESGKEA